MLENQEQVEDRNTKVPKWASSCIKEAQVHKVSIRFLWRLP